MNIESPIAKLGGWRFKHYPTRTELKNEIRELENIRQNMRTKIQEAEAYIFDLEVTLGVIAEIAQPTQDDKE